MSDTVDTRPYRDYHPDEPIVFRAPAPEVMAELRRLLPPVPPAAERAA